MKIALVIANGEALLSYTKSPLLAAAAAAIAATPETRC
jgi:hypothetical protein